MITIGPYTLRGRAVLAPMAGVSDVPFRQICRRLGAAMVTAEMSSSDPSLRRSEKSQRRLSHPDDPEPRTVQIVGTEPQQMADAAAYQVQAGAQIIDINMGCPAKKVCKKLAGSALLRNEQRVREILQAVVQRVDVPVTLKIRTGWDPSQRNAVAIAQLAESLGIQSLAVHGRTRACRFRGSAEYDTIAAVAQAVSIPVFANGDIDSATTAQTVLDYTAASGVMIGRGAQGQPWIFQQINQLLGSGNKAPLFNHNLTSQGDTIAIESLIMEHLRQIHCYYDFYNNNDRQKQGKITAALPVSMARKHICWYFGRIAQIIGGQSCLHAPRGSSEPSDRPISQVVERRATGIAVAKKQFNQLQSQTAQRDYLKDFFERLHSTEDIAA